MIEFYTKQGCSLCDKAKAIVDPVAEDEGVRVSYIDIEKDPALMQQYGEQIPVVFVGGRKAFKFRVDESKLRELIRRARERHDES